MPRPSRMLVALGLFTWLLAALTLSLNHARADDSKALAKQDRPNVVSVVGDEAPIE